MTVPAAASRPSVVERRAGEVARGGVDERVAGADVERERVRRARRRPARPRRRTRLARPRRPARHGSSGSRSRPGSTRRDAGAVRRAAARPAARRAARPGRRRRRRGRGSPRRPAGRCARRSRPAGRPGACPARARPGPSGRASGRARRSGPRRRSARRPARRAPRRPGRSGCRAGRRSRASSAPAAARTRARSRRSSSYGALSEPSGRRCRTSPSSSMSADRRVDRVERRARHQPDHARASSFTTPGCGIRRSSAAHSPSARRRWPPAASSSARARVRVDAGAQHRDRHLRVLAGGVQRRRGLLARRARGLLDDPGRAVAQLLVGHADVDHQVPVGLAEPDHRQRREHVQHELLRGAGLQARRAGDELRADEHLDRVLDRGAERASRRCRRGRP